MPISSPGITLRIKYEVYNIYEVFETRWAYWHSRHRATELRHLAADSVPSNIYFYSVSGPVSAKHTLLAAWWLPQRVCLVPLATAVLCALGNDHLTHTPGYCDPPPAPPPWGHDFPLLGGIWCMRSHGYFDGPPVQSEAFGMQQWYAIRNNKQQQLVNTDCCNEHYR